MNATKLRAWWAHRQGLDGRLAGSAPAAVLEETGWARSVGGAGPYLTLRVRAGIGRGAADAAAANQRICELPSARGCTYVLPASDFALGLKVGRGFRNERKTANQLGVTDKEIDRLCRSVLEALARGPMDPEELREATGGAVRNLGEAGKKKGLTTTLPVALGLLQSEGEIRRVPTNGRFDQQRYRYERWRPSPMEKFKLTSEEAHTELARRFFRWIGPAALPEFQWFSGLGVKACKAAVEPLGLVPLEKGDERWMLPRDRDELENFKAPQKPHYVLVSSLDGISHLRRDVRGLLSEEDLKQPVFGGKGRQAAGGLTDLPDHAILDHGRLIGLWEYDLETESIVWMTFGIRDKALEAAVEETAQFIRKDLGDARTFSLDSPKSRVPRIEALRKGMGK